MTAANTNPSTSTEFTTEARQQAEGVLSEGGSVTLMHPLTGITAFIRPRKPGVVRITVEIFLAPALRQGFVSEFETLPQAVSYLLTAGYEPCDPPKGRVRIADFREAVERLSWTRADIAGARRDEFARIDVPGRLSRAILAVQVLRGGVSERFVADLRAADATVGRARETIEAWLAGRRDSAAANG